MDDPRLTPARPDLAAKYLEGKVKAARFVDGEEFEIVDAHRAAARGAVLRCGADDAGAEGRARDDLRPQRRRLGLGPARQRRLCRLAARSRAGKARRQRRRTRSRRSRTFAFPGPSIKLPPVETLPMGARSTVTREDGAFAVTREGRYLPRQHLGALDAMSTISSRSPNASSARPISGAARAASASIAPAWCRSR